jgi:hypothetical protein
VDEIYDAFNIFTSSLNTFIVFFWVNNKLGHTAINEHNHMIKYSMIILLIYYIVFIFISYFPRAMADYSYSAKFLLFPNFEEDIRYAKGTLDYYMNLSNIGLNIFSQLVVLNFYYIILKKMILREKVAAYLNGKR